MARLFSTGFESQSVTSGVEWNTTAGSPTIDTTTKRSGAASLRFNPSSVALTYIETVIGTVSDDVWSRINIRVASLPSTMILLMLGWEAGGNLWALYMNTDGTLELWGINAAGTALEQKGSDSAALSTDQWYRLEVYAKTSTTTFSFTARIDGVNFATGTTSFSVTADTDGVTIGAIGISNPATIATTTTSTDIYFDDIAINDDAGTSQNSWPGPGSIVHMHPDASGDAAATTGTFADIDEVTPDDATSYIEIDDNGAANYNFETSATRGIAATDVISLVSVGVRHRPETAAAAAYTPQIKSVSAGTTTSGTSTSHNDTTWKSNGDATPNLYKLVSYTDPESGGSWTPALLDTMIAGVNVTDAAPDLWISNIWALVEYIPTVDNITYPVVTKFASSVTSMPVLLPPSLSGDLLLAFVEVRNSGTWTVPTDWTEFEAQLGGGSVGELTAFYKIAAGTEGSIATWTASTGTTAIWQVRTVTDWHGTTPPESDTASGDASTADPPSLTPSWGSAENIWIAVAGHTAAVINAFSAGPSGYSGHVNEGASSGGAAVSLSTAYKVATGTSEDPGTFTVDGSNRWWAAATIAVRPAAASGTDVTSDRGAHITGKVDTTSDRGAHITGQNAANADRGAHIIGTADTTSDRPGHIIGQDTASSDRAAHTTGALSANADRAAHLMGEADVTSDRPGHITGTLSTTDDRDAHITGQTAASADRGAHITGNSPPTVALNDPSDEAIITDTTPTFDFTGTDVNGDDIRYQIQIDTVNTFDEGQAEQVDQQQNSTGANFGFGEFASGRYRGQVFTAGITGNLTKVGFARNKGSQGIKVYFDTVDGSNHPANPVGSELYSFTITNANVIDEYGEYTLPTPLAVTSGTKYCFYLAPWNTSTDAYADDYNDVRGISSVSGGVTEITNTAGTWSTENLTFQYKTYVDPPGPLLGKVSGTDAGFVNPDNGGDTDPFTTGENIQFTVQAGDALTAPDTYYWRVRATDPSGSNIYGDWSSTRSFSLSATASDDRDAHITGQNAASDDRDAHITGQVSVTNDRAAHITGQVLTTNDRGAHITGEIAVTADRAAHISGEADVTSDRGAKLTGSSSGDTSDRAAHLIGKADTSDDRDAHITGKIDTTDDRDAHITGIASTSDDRDAHITGSLSAAAERSAHLTGDVDTSSDRSGRITGIRTSTASRGAHLIGKADTNSDRAAHISGELTSTSDRSANIVGSGEASSTRGARMYGCLPWQTDTDTPFADDESTPFASDSSGDWASDTDQSFATQNTGKFVRDTLC